MREAAPSFHLPQPSIVYRATKVGQGLRAEADWHQLQLLRVAEEARQAAAARSLPARAPRQQ